MLGRQESVLGRQESVLCRERESERYNIVSVVNCGDVICDVM